MPSPDEAKALKATERKVFRTRQIPANLRRSPDDPEIDPDLTDYAGKLGRIYRAAATHAGARVVVDASKRPADAAGLQLAPGIDTYFVHVVRDPRAVAYSWQRPAQPGLAEFAPRRVAVMWGVVNAASIYISRWAGDRSILVRYEDFVRDPRRILESIVRMTGESARELPVDGSQVRLRAQHTAGANPRHAWDRVIELKEDDEWVRSMPPRQRALVTALSSPYLEAVCLPAAHRSPGDGGTVALPGRRALR